LCVPVTGEYYFAGYHVSSPKQNSVLYRGFLVSVTKTGQLYRIDSRHSTRHPATTVCSGQR